MLRPRRMLVEEADALCWTAQHSTTSRGLPSVHLPRRRAASTPQPHAQVTPPRRILEADAAVEGPEEGYLSDGTRGGHSGRRRTRGRWPPRGAKHQMDSPHAEGPEGGRRHAPNSTLSNRGGRTVVRLPTQIED